MSASFPSSQSDATVPDGPTSAGNGHLTSATRGAKRAAPAAAEYGSYPRKRALYACLVCRRRKSRCDNARPKCGFCASVGAACVYNTADQAADSHNPTDHDILLERINYVVSLLESKGSNSGDGSHLIPASEHSQAGSHASREPETNRCVTHWSMTNRILRWPILGIDDPGAFLMSVFVPETDMTEETIARQLAVVEDDFPSHIRSFLANVHIKNPVVDHKSLTQHARHAVEYGISWDGPSCMVLIASALGLVAQPFRRISTSQPCVPESNLALADVYYASARKRLGCLRINSLLFLQCSFLSGVYEMYKFRPLDAWHSFHTACHAMQTYFRTRDPQRVDIDTKNLEERLYWSCLKSELELRTEIDVSPIAAPVLPASEFLPNPPAEDLATPEEFPLQESWYYYLSEISQNHTIYRIMNTFYSASDETELLRMSVDSMVSIATELERGEALVASRLPSWLHPQGETDDHELPWIIRGRVFFVRGCLFQPFLFLANHSTTPLPPVVYEFAQHCLQACYDMICHYDIQHRHHGAWLVARATLRSALLIIAAVKGGKVVVRQNWQSYIETAMGVIDFWGKESEDLRKMTGLLRTLYEEMDCSSPIFGGSDMGRLRFERG